MGTGAGIMKIIEFDYQPNPSGIRGFYDEDVPGYIYVRRDLCGLERELVVAHEAQHAKCHRIKCDCFDLRADFHREYHAFRAELRYMCTFRFTRKTWLEYTRIVYAGLEKYSEVEVWDGNFKALAAVCKLKLFKEYTERFGVHKKIMKLVSGGL